MLDAHHLPASCAGDRPSAARHLAVCAITLLFALLMALLDDRRGTDESAAGTSAMRTSAVR